MISTEHLKIAYKILSDINKKAYKDIFLLSNQVLSKNPSTNNFLNNFIFHKKVKNHSAIMLIFKLLKYYVKSIVHFVVYVANVLIFIVKGPKYYFPQNFDNLIIINIFLLIDKIKQSKRFVDTYLPGLEDLLKKMNKQYVYLPVFDHYTMSITYGNILKILKKKRVPILCEYQLLSFTDLFYILYFIVVYPFHVMRCARALSKDKYEMNLVKYELLSTLDQVTFYNFSRYLQGKRISRLPYKKIKVISWFENQTGDKNFYKGLRANPDKVIIYGAQLFLYAKTDLNIIVDDDEEQFGIIPDRIIVNGSFFIPEKSKLNYIVGPSLRYKKVFDTKINRKMQRDFLVLLPYAQQEEENIFRVLYDVNFGENNIIIKTHPANKHIRCRQYICSNYKIIDSDLYDLFKNTKIAVGATSGSLLEAASVGIPVIVIKTPDSLDYDILPEYGKGLIWEKAADAGSLQRAIQTIEQRLNKEIDAINRISKDYREMFFLEPNESNIIRVFDLN
jgi:hypothetical protein